MTSKQTLAYEIDKARIRFTKKSAYKHLVRCELGIQQQNYVLLIDDEYNDFDLANPPLCWLLCLYALEDYQESTDYLDWCKDYNLSSNDALLLDYYKNLGGIINSLESADLNLEPPLSYYDYHLGAGDISELRNLR